MQIESEHICDVTASPNGNQQHCTNELFNSDSNYYEDVQDDYELMSDRLTIIKDAWIGSGHYGRVCLGIVQCNITNRRLPVAVKMVKFDNDIDLLSSSHSSKNDEYLKQVIAKQINALRIELNILAYIQRLNDRPHPNLIRLIGATTTNENEFYLMSEYCEYGSLDCYLREKYKKKQFIDEIVSNGSDENSDEKVVWKILHRDVALRNIFLKLNMIIKLGDFELSRQLIDGSTTYLPSKTMDIPIRYVALETLLFTIYTIEAECWTFGIVLWELFSFAQRLPYEEELPTFSVAELKLFLSSGRRLNVPVMAPRPIQKLMQETWCVNSQKRPDFQFCQSIIRNTIDDALGMLRIVDWRNLSANYYSKRTMPITIIRLRHSIAMTAIETLNAFNNAQSSAHYVVERNGTIFQLVDESNHTWHPGEQIWSNNTNIISVSIEIEIINRDNEPFPSEQVRAVALLCRQITTRYDIHPNNIIGNSDSAPESEHDPSAYFDWRLLYSIVGIYPLLYDSHLTADEQSHVLHDTDAQFDMNVQNVQRQLKTYGYSLTNDHLDGRYGPHTKSIAVAFNRHFCPEVFVMEEVVNHRTIVDPRNQRWYRLSQERLDYLISNSKNMHWIDKH